MDDRTMKFYKTKVGKVIFVLFFISACVKLYFTYVKFTSINTNSCVTCYKSKDYGSAYEKCSALANKGNALGKLILGDMYANGYHVQKDYDRAEQLYNEVAESEKRNQLRRGAYSALGGLYLRKDFERYDIKVAAKWFKLSADLGASIAQYKYGVMLFAGYGTERNLDLAREYLTKAANNGLKEKAEEILGIINSPEADEAANEMLKMWNARELGSHLE